MPIDASANPYDGGLDPDDLTLAGKGAAAAAATSKGLEAAEADDDLADAGKGAAPGGEPDEPFDADGILKDPGDSDSLDLGGAATGATAVDALDEDGDLLDSKLDTDDGGDDLFGSKLGGDDGDDDLFSKTAGDGLDDDPDDIDVKDFDVDVDQARIARS